MPPLKNIRHERFARFRSQGDSASVAYQKAYHCTYDSARFNQHRLTTNNHVRDRTLELLDKKIGDEVASDALNLSIQDPDKRVSALRLYYELKGKIGNRNSVSVDVNQLAFPIEDETAKKLAEEIRRLSLNPRAREGRES